MFDNNLSHTWTFLLSIIQVALDHEKNNALVVALTRVDQSRLDKK